MIEIHNTASWYATLFVKAGGCTFNLYSFSGGVMITTNGAHPINIRANQYAGYPAGLTISTNNAVTCNTSFTNNSDASLKTDMISVSTAQAIEVLKAIEPKV